MDTIYRWFTFLFGGDMANYLAGFKCASENARAGFSGSNQFIMYGTIAVLIAFGITFIFYYGANHPRFNRWHSWLSALVVVGISNFFIGAVGTLSSTAASDIGNCLINGNNGGISDYSCWMFGLANFFVSAIFFAIFSFGLKWWSRNCKRIPF